MTSSSSNSWVRKATYASVATAGILVTVKLIAWQLTDSLSMLASLVDSLLDGLASLINLFAVRHAQVPADNEHRFGHGKAEPLAALGQATFITGSAIFLFVEAIRRFMVPQTLSQELIGMSVVGFAILLTLGLVIFQNRVIKLSGSLAIRSDSLHYKSDLLINLAVFVVFLLSFQFSWVYIDPIFSVVIAGYVLYSAWSIARGALNMLMDHEFPESERERIKALICQHPEVRKMGDLRTRESGPQRFVQCRIGFDPQLQLAKVDEFVGQIEHRLHEAFPNTEIFIHSIPYRGNEH